MSFKGVIESIEKNFGNLLYYPGCLTKFVLPQIEINYKKILDFIGTDYISLKEEFYCCGSPVRNAGYKEDFSDLIDKNVNLFSKHNVTKLVSNCPSCSYIFKNNYPLEVIHITQLIFKNLQKPKFRKLKEFLLQKINDNNKINVIYHDSCTLGRKLNVYDEPREIIKFFGYNLLEFSMNRENSICCGAGGGLKDNFPNIANGVAIKKIVEAKALNSHMLITACPMCYEHFKNNNKNSDLQIYELSQIIVEFIDKFNSSYNFADSADKEDVVTNKSSFVVEDLGIDVV